MNPEQISTLLNQSVSVAKEIVDQCVEGGISHERATIALLATLITIQVAQTDAINNLNKPDPGYKVG